MARVLWIEDEQELGKVHPGCMASLFHTLDGHYWHSYVKKILPHRKHEALIKHAKGTRRYERISDYQDPFEVLKLFDAKTSHNLVDQSNKKALPSQRRSLKARIKALISEDSDMEQDQDSVSSPKLQRTYSIHHSETNEWVHPIIFFPENATESPVSSKTHVNFTPPEVNDSQDILDMFQVDKELFINTLQDRSLSSDTKPKLTKSGSFPTPVSRTTLMPMKLEDKLNEMYTISKAEKTNNTDSDDRNIMCLRRISSLKESADGYTRFLDFSVGKEATLRSSRSLKLTYGSESLFKNSLNQGSRDAYLLRSSSQNERNPVSLFLYKDKYAELNSTQDCEFSNEVMYKGDIFLGNKHSPKVNSPSFCQDSYGLKIQEDNYQISKENTQEGPVLVPGYCPRDEKVQISKVLQENVEKEIKTVNNKKHMESSMKDDDFTYVKKILERSGFIKNGFHQTWYSYNHPLDPFVFQEIESHYFHDPKLFAEEVNALSHRLLIFDLVDEVLLTMYERLLAYYPKKLSPFCHIRPTPTGSLVLDEVWNSISRWLNFKHDINESLNDIVSRDLRSDDCWMNLQLDCECVGLDLEDLILDKVLEEMVFELMREGSIEK